MKLWVLVLCFLPISLFASTSSRDLVQVYQELCAKEPDPLKRQNYCRLLESKADARVEGSIFRQDRAVV